MIAPSIRYASRRTVSPTPIWSRNARVQGESPLPQTLVRGNALRSRSVHSAPARVLNAMAAADPAGPAPITTTRFIGRSLAWKGPAWNPLEPQHWSIQLDQPSWNPLSLEERSSSDCLAASTYVVLVARGGYLPTFDSNSRSARSGRWRLKLSIACNFDDALIEGLSSYPVYEVFGKLTRDYFGGGRPSFYLPEVNRARLARYVRLVHAHGIGFNYLLNASTMGNDEYSREGQRQMEALLEWLDAIRIDSVTV